MIYNSFSIQRVYFNREGRKGFYEVMATICTFTKRGKREEEKREKIPPFDDKSIGTRDFFFPILGYKKFGEFFKKKGEIRGIYT